MESTGAGWMLFLLEDGEQRPIDLHCFEVVLVFWRQFVRKYLPDAPAFGLGSRYAGGAARPNGSSSTAAIFRAGTTAGRWAQSGLVGGEHTGPCRDQASLAVRLRLE